jgi:hypothetical protein
VTRGEIALAIIFGLLVNEATDLCPWLAVRLVCWAARLRYLHASDHAAIRSEELAALVNDRPGKLFKLFTALGFVLHALTVQTAPRSVRRFSAGAIKFTTEHRADIVRIGSGVVAAAVAVAMVVGTTAQTVAGVVVGAAPVVVVGGVAAGVMARVASRRIVVRIIVGVVVGAVLGAMLGVVLGTVAGVVARAAPGAFSEAGSVAIVGAFAEAAPVALAGAFAGTMIGAGLAAVFRAESKIED